MLGKNLIRLCIVYKSSGLSSTILQIKWNGSPVMLNTWETFRQNLRPIRSNSYFSDIQDVSPTTSVFAKMVSVSYILHQHTTSDKNLSIRGAEMALWWNSTWQRLSSWILVIWHIGHVIQLQVYFVPCWIFERKPSILGVVTALLR